MMTLGDMGTIAANDFSSNSGKFVEIVTAELEALHSEEKRMVLPRFFKCGAGEYGEGDRFLGVVVPDVLAEGTLPSIRRSGDCCIHWQFDDTYALAVKLMSHKHNLMHKAVGWMLREAGKRDRPHYKKRLTPRKSIIIFDEIQKCPRTSETIMTLVQDHHFDYLGTAPLISIKKCGEQQRLRLNGRHT